MLSLKLLVRLSNDCSATSESLKRKRSGNSTKPCTSFFWKLKARASRRTGAKSASDCTRSISLPRGRSFVPYAIRIALASSSLMSWTKSTKALKHYSWRY